MDIKEKIVDILHRHYYPTMHESIADCTLIECADQILALIREAGYRKTEGKPPVLSDDKLIDVTWHKVEGESSVSHLRAAAQAQHDADVRFYDKQIVNKENKENL